MEGSLKREKGMSSGEGRVSDKIIGQLCCRAQGVAWLWSFPLEFSAVQVQRQRVDTLSEVANGVE